MIGAEELDQASSRWTINQLTHIRAHSPAERAWVKKATNFTTISVDGKESRSAKHGHGSRSHKPAAADYHTGVVIGQVAVGDNFNEIPYLKKPLASIHASNPRFLQGAVVTVDALHTQLETASMIRSYRCEYVMTVKGNQPPLQAACAVFPWDQIPVTDMMEDWEHGRYVRRELKLVQLVGALAVRWPWALPVGQLTRRAQRTKYGSWSVETVYVLTSLAPEATNLVVNHWGFENKVHWVRDSSFGED